MNSKSPEIYLWSLWGVVNPDQILTQILTRLSVAIVQVLDPSSVTALEYCSTVYVCGKGVLLVS